MKGKDKNGERTKNALISVMLVRFNFSSMYDFVMVPIFSNTFVSFIF